MILANVFSIGELIFLIPILGIIVGGISVLVKHQQKMKQMELDAQSKGLVTNPDISRELAEAIQQEFTRMSQENDALREDVRRLQHQVAQFSPHMINPEEVAKQVQASQQHS